MDSKVQTWFRQWRLQLAILTAIIIPTLAADGAYHDLEKRSIERETLISTRVNSLEVSNVREFVDKQELREMHDDIKEMRGQISEIKTLLIQQRR